MGSNLVWLVSLRQGEMWTQRRAQKEDDVKRHREKMAIRKTRREAWNRPFLHSLQQEPTLPTRWFQTSCLQNCRTINFCYFGHPVCGALLHISPGAWIQHAKSVSWSINGPWRAVGKNASVPTTFSSIFCPSRILVMTGNSLPLKAGRFICGCLWQSQKSDAC